MTHYEETIMTQKCETKFIVTVFIDNDSINHLVGWYVNQTLTTLGFSLQNIARLMKVKIMNFAYKVYQEKCKDFSYSLGLVQKQLLRQIKDHIQFMPSYK